MAGYVVVAISFLCSTIGMLLVARAAVALRARLGQQEQTLHLLWHGAKAVVSARVPTHGSGSAREVALAEFAHRVRLALLLIALPTLIVAALRLRNF